jgi:hypothetical protein
MIRISRVAGGAAVLMRESNLDIAGLIRDLALEEEKLVPIPPA